MAEHAQKPSDQHDIYQAASRAVEKDDEEWPEYAKRKFPKKLVKVLAIVVVILVLAGGGYEIFKATKSNKPAQTANSASNGQPKPASDSNSNTTQQYTATGSDLNLSFSYPTSWTVSPASGTDTTNQTITVNSPSTTIENADNSSITGKITVLIRAGGASLNELNSGNPTTAQNSTQFAYNSPAADQHQYPYLTFIHFSSGSKTPGAFEEVMITGVQPFAAAEQVSPGDLSQLDPVISASFYKCSDTACAGQADGILSITNSTWQNDNLFVQAQKLFASLKLN